MNGDASARNKPLVSDDRVKALMQRLIYNVVHVEKRLTMVQIAEESGVGYNTVSCYASLRTEAQRQPSLGIALSIAVVLGERAVNAVLALIGYGGAKPLDEADAFLPSVAAADALSHLSVIITAAAGGRIDHTRDQECREAADIIIADILPFSSAGHAV